MYKRFKRNIMSNILIHHLSVFYYLKYFIFIILFYFFYRRLHVHLWHPFIIKLLLQF
jgi:hypothetical protein